MRAKRIRVFLAAACMAACCIAIRPSDLFAGPFAAGDLVVLRVGDGTGSLNSNMAAVFLDEYTTNGAFVQSIALPTGTPGPNRLTLSGTAASEGYLTLSQDGRYLLLAGYNAALGTSVNSSTPRVIARVDMSGNIDTSTATTTSFGGTSNFRSAVSLDGYSLWAAGSASPGAAFATLGNSSWSPLSTTPTPNLRVLGILNNQLLVSSGASTVVSVNTVGSGMPVTGAQTVAVLPGMTSGTNAGPYDYWFSDANTVYVTNDTGASPFKKWTKSTGSWSVASFTSSPPCRGVTGKTGSPNTVFLTNISATSQVIRAVDSGSGSDFSIAIATAPTNTAFRGIRLLPTNTCGTITLDGIADTAYGTALATQQAQLVNNADFAGTDSTGGQFDCANGSELDRAFGVIRGGTLYLTIAGNLKSNFEKMVVFVDSQSGGQNSLRGDNDGGNTISHLGNNGGNGNWGGGGMVFDSGFAPDYALGINLDSACFKLYSDFFTLPTSSGGTRTFLGSTTSAGGDGTLTAGTNTNNIKVTINNANVGGVTTASAANAASAVTGVELAIPLAAIGNPSASVTVSIILADSNYDHLSNQVLGSLASGAFNYGHGSFRNFANNSDATGDQYFTVSVSETTPAVTAQPSNAAVCPGGNASFTIAATGAGTLSYQWRRGTTSLINGANGFGTTISGATLPTLTLTNVHAGDAGTDYNCLVTNECGSANSNNATLTVNATPGLPTSLAATLSEYCSTNTPTNVTLSATLGSNATAVDWYTGSCGGTSIGSGTSLLITAPTSTTTYYARSRSATTGCIGSACASVTVTVNTPPGSCGAAEQAKLIASDGAAGDSFGFSAAMSGDTAVVGAYFDDDAGGNSGSAYVFVRSGGVWTQQAKLTASDMAANDQFGISVAISGETILVGALNDDNAGGTDAGSAYVFVRSGTTWTEQAKLIASDAAAGDQFGHGVALEGDTAVAGSPEDNLPGAADAGSAYVFVRSGTTWTQQAKLTASDAAAGDNFGIRVAVSNDTVLAGANLEDNAGGTDAGSAYVYLRTGTTWSQQAKLTASDAAAGDNLGGRVAVAGDTAVVTSYLDDDGGVDSGSAYVFARSGVVWTQQAKLTASDAAANDNFGFSAALSGDMILVGAPGDNNAGGSNAGSAYVFVRTAGGWANMTETSKLTASDASAGDQFGRWAALSEGTALIGAFGDDIASAADAGSAYVYVGLKPRPNQPGASAPPSSYCSNAVPGSISLSATLGANEEVDWYTGSCGGTPIGSGTPLTVTPAPTTTTTYYARARSTITCCLSDGCGQVTVTVASPPSGVSAGGNQTICETSIATLSGTASNYATLAWTSSGTGSFSAPGGLSTTYTPSANDINAGSVILMLTASNPPCANAADSMTLTIRRQPSGVDAGVPSANICEGAELSLSGTASNYLTLAWSTTGTGSFTSPNSLNTNYIPSMADITNGGATLTLTASNPPCANAADSLGLTIQRLPSVTVDDNFGICTPNNITLNGLTDNTTNCLWTTSGDGTFADNADPTTTYTPSTNDIAAELVVLTLTCQGMGPCSMSSDFDSVTVTIHSTPQITLEPVGGTVGQGSSFSFTVAATGGGLSYQWYKGVTPLSNGDHISGAQSTTLTINPAAAADAGTYYCIVTNDCGSDQSNNAELIVNSEATVTLAAPPGCVNGNQLVVSVNMSSAPAVIVGGQFFFAYDNDVLDFVSIDPGDAPFTRQISELVDEVNGEIDYVVGIPDGGTGTSSDTTMARITFNILQNVCTSTADLVTWRASGPNGAINKLSDDNGNEVSINDINLGAIRIDNTEPVINCPPDASLQCAGLAQAAAIDLAGFLGQGGTVSDNCSGTIVVIHVGDANNGGAGCPGDPLIITRTYRATDDCGNFAECDQTFTVSDTTAPSITCPAAANVQCVADVPAANIAAVTTSDNCDPTPTVIHVGDTNNGGTGCLGNPLVITRTYRATDDCGNSAQCTQTITVLDNTNPMITCPAAANVQCLADVPAVDTGSVTTSDNCDANPTVTHQGDTNNGGTGCPGNPLIITRTYRATDDCGNSAQCTQTITVLDNMAPLITCPANVSVQCVGNVPAPNVGSVSATDNCDSTPTITHQGDTNNGGTGCPGNPRIITRTYRATDDCGNFAQCTQTITVLDNTPPLITCPANATISCDESDEPGILLGTATGGVMIYYNATGAEAPDNRAYLKAQFSYPNTNGAAFSFSNAALTGNGLLTWAGLFGQDVNSQFGFDFVLPAPTNNGSVLPPALIAYENTNNSPAGRMAAGQVLWLIGDYKDDAPNGPGNTNNLDINSLFRGPTPPNPMTDLVITRNDVTQAGTLFTAQIAGKLVSDNFIHWYSPATPNSAMAAYAMDGEFFFKGTLTYDSTGDDGSDRKDFYAGSITISANSPTTSIGFATATDNCTLFPVVTYSDVETAGACPQEKTIARTWRATDACGNSSTCTQTITVEDNTAPNITCPANVSVQCVGDVPAVNIASVTTSDNCDSTPTLTHQGDTNNGGAGCAANPRIITRTYRATDDCGNFAECTQTITVVDNTNPTITCPGPVNVQCATDVPAVNTASVTASDNCDATPTVTHQGDANNGGSGCPGNPLIITRTYRATDDCGNFAECTQTITVLDNLAPVLAPCPANITVNADAGSCSAVVSFTLPNATDNCDSSPTVAASPASGSTFAGGTTTVTVTATDDCNNISQCTFTVTVNPVNEVLVTLQLGGGVVSGGPFTRAITFDLWNTGVSASAPLHTQCKDIVFTAGSGSATLSVPCQATGYTCVTARDRLHTLRRTISPIPITGAQYSPSFTGAAKSLISGNLNDDKFIDILDFGIYTIQDLNPAPGGANTLCGQNPPFRHADVNGDGIVGSTDFTFIANNFFAIRDANCNGSTSTILAGDDSPGGNYGATPLAQISVANLIRRGMAELIIMDLNHDGWLNQTDMTLWLQGVRPPKPKIPIAPTIPLEVPPASNK